MQKKLTAQDVINYIHNANNAKIIKPDKTAHDIRSAEFVDGNYIFRLFETEEILTLGNGEIEEISKKDGKYQLLTKNQEHYEINRTLSPDLHLYIDFKPLEDLEDDEIEFFNKRADKIRYYLHSQLKYPLYCKCRIECAFRIEVKSDNPVICNYYYELGIITDTDFVTEKPTQTHIRGIRLYLDTTNEEALIILMNKLINNLIAADK